MIAINSQSGHTDNYNSKNIFPLVIIADDLTGALDGAAVFCSIDIEVVVAVTLDAFEEALETEADVIAVSTGSRECSPNKAAQLVKRAVALSGKRVVFKKIDSRLKGNLSDELVPFENKSLFVVPALPSFGRYVEDGFVKGFGVNEPIDIRNKLGKFEAKSVVPDCKTERDIAIALDVFLQNNCENKVLVGARGLTFALAQRAGLKSRKPAQLSGKIGMVIGSLDPITNMQFEKLPNQKVAKILAPSGVLEEGYLEGVNAEKVCVALKTTKGATSDPVLVGRQLAKSFKQIAQRCDTLVLTGGATAQSVLAELGIDMLYMEGEIFPGLPVSRSNKWRIVTKSGGFGDDNTLSRLLG